MNGLWKENVSGWNHKDTRRKKQSRKHYIKDKGKAIYLKFGRNGKHTADKNVFRIENEQEIIYNPYHYMDIKKYAEVFNIEIVYYELDDNGLEDKNKPVFKNLNVYIDPNKNYYNDVFYEEKSRKELDDYLGLIFLQRYEIISKKPTGRKIETNWKEIKDAYDVDKIYSFWSTEKTYMYNTLIPGWKVDTFFDDGKRRKIAQKKAHHKDRQNLRKYLKEGDWDKEIKTHYLSKSIAWEVY
jgi:hypothetical protein